MVETLDISVDTRTKGRSRKIEGQTLEIIGYVLTLNILIIM